MNKSYYIATSIICLSLANCDSLHSQSETSLVRGGTLLLKSSQGMFAEPEIVVTDTKEIDSVIELANRKNQIISLPAQTTEISIWQPHGLICKDHEAASAASLRVEIAYGYISSNDMRVLATRESYKQIEAYNLDLLSTGKIPTEWKCVVAPNYN